jgi:hypothetical protein
MSQLFIKKNEKNCSQKIYIDENISKKNFKSSKFNEFDKK